MAQVVAEKITLFDFPDTVDSDEQRLAENKVLRAMMPFAVIGSETVHEVNGKKIRGRRYPWGIVEGALPRRLARRALVARPNPNPVGR